MDPTCLLRRRELSKPKDRDAAGTNPPFDDADPGSNGPRHLRALHAVCGAGQAEQRLRLDRRSGFEPGAIHATRPRDGAPRRVLRQLLRDRFPLLPVPPLDLYRRVPHNSGVFRNLKPDGGFNAQFIVHSAGKPFFIEVATFAPHAPYVPTRRDEDAFPEVRPPRTPAFAAAPKSDTRKWLSRLPPLSKSDIAAIDRDFRKRAQSVLAVDRMIGDLQTAVAASGQRKTPISSSAPTTAITWVNTA